MPFEGPQKPARIALKRICHLLREKMELPAGAAIVRTESSSTVIRYSAGFTTEVSIEEVQDVDTQSARGP